MLLPICYNLRRDTMDPAIWNRIGIGVELIGTLLAAPELIDRIIGLERLEESFKRIVGRLGTLGAAYIRRYLRALGRTGPGWSWEGAPRTRFLLVLLIGNLYSGAYLATIVFVDASRDPANLGSWWPFWLFGVWPVLFWATLYLLAVITPMVMAIFLVMSNTTRQLEKGWVRTAAVVSGAGLFISGLAMQFVATF